MGQVCFKQRIVQNWIFQTTGEKADSLFLSTEHYITEISMDGLQILHLNTARETVCCIDSMHTRTVVQMWPWNKLQYVQFELEHKTQRTKEKTKIRCLYCYKYFNKVTLTCQSADYFLQLAGSHVCTLYLLWWELSMSSHEAYIHVGL